MIQPGSILEQSAGQLGGKVRIAPSVPASAIAQRGTLMQLSAPTSNFSVCFSISLDAKVRSAIPAGSNHLVRAEIQWGSPKGKGLVIADVGSGFQLSLVGTSLAVYIYMVSANGNIIVGPTIEVYGSIGAGTVSTSNKLTFTEQQRLILVGAASIWNVPAYASAVEFVSDADPNAAIPNTFTALVAGDPNIGAGARTITRITGANTPVALPNGASSIEVTNNGPVNINYTPVFHLSL